MNRELQLPLARIRRVEQHQATMINGVIRDLGADLIAMAEVAELRARKRL
jgi:hypothetical protein